MDNGTVVPGGDTWYQRWWNQDLNVFYLVPILLHNFRYPRLDTEFCSPSDNSDKGHSRQPGNFEPGPEMTFLP